MAILAGEVALSVTVSGPTADSGAFAYYDQVAYDTFDRADSSSGLGTSTSGHTWVQTFGTAGIQTNKAYRVSGTPLAVVETGLSDCYIDLKLDTFGTGGSYNQSGIIFRNDGGSTNGWFFRANSSFGVYQLATMSGVENYTGGPAPASGQHLRAVLAGSSIKCYVDDVLIFDKSSSAHSTLTQHGFIMNADTNIVFDDFSVFTNSEIKATAGTFSPTGVTQAFAEHASAAVTAHNVVRPITAEAEGTAQAATAYGATGLGGTLPDEVAVFGTVSDATTTSINNVDAGTATGTTTASTALAGATVPPDVITAVSVAYNVSAISNSSALPDSAAQTASANNASVAIAITSPVVGISAVISQVLVAPSVSPTLVSATVLAYAAQIRGPRVVGNRIIRVERDLDFVPDVGEGG